MLKLTCDLMEVHRASLSRGASSKYIVLIPTSDDNGGPVLVRRMHVDVAHEPITVGDVVIVRLIRGRLLDRLRKCWYTVVVLLAYRIVLSRRSSTCSLQVCLMIMLPVLLMWLSICWLIRCASLLVHGVIARTIFFDSNLRLRILGAGDRTFDGRLLDLLGGG
jgi:hypothetical protein